MRTWTKSRVLDTYVHSCPSSTGLSCVLGCLCCLIWIGIGLNLKLEHSHLSQKRMKLCRDLFVWKPRGLWLFLKTMDIHFSACGPRKLQNGKWFLGTTILEFLHPPRRSCRLPNARKALTVPSVDDEASATCLRRDGYPVANHNQILRPRCYNQVWVPIQKNRCVRV